MVKVKFGEGVYGEDDDYSNVFRENLIAFLITEKKFPRESLNHGILAEAPDFDLTVTHPDTDSILAIFDFKSENYKMNFPKLSEFLAKVHKKGFVGKYNPFVYIVCPSKESNEDFVIFEVEDDRTSNEISYEDFPIYDQLLFASPLSDPGRRIYRALIRLAKDKHGFSIHTPCQDYIDLQIKKNNKTVAQIHRLNDSDDNISLVLAGYQKYFPEAKQPIYMFEGELKQLSGYASKSSGEKNWLEGNIGHPQLKYKASVYILRPGALVLEEIENEVGNLLELARKNVATMTDDKANIKDNKAQTIGNVATMADDKASVKDLLGRMGLVEALANMFVHNKEMEGFTVALFGNWGEGKSTIMNLLTNKLKEKRPGHFDFATFNAWEYEHTKNIAAGLAQEVVKGLVGELSKLEKAKLTFNFARKEYGWGFLKCLFYLAVAAALPLVTWFISTIIDDIGDLKNFIQGFLGVGSVAVIGTLAYHLYSSIKKVVEHPMAIQLQTYLKLPNYGEHLGLIPVLKRHIEILCQLKLGESRKLVVFVDDLDRCQPKCIAETLDAIRLVTAVQRVNVFICIDHRIAFKAIEEHYKKVGDVKKKEGIARDYLGKLIQLPIRLQEPTIRGLEEFIDGRLFPNIVESPSRAEESDTEIQSQQPEYSKVGQEKVGNVEDEKTQPTSDSGKRSQAIDTEIAEEEMRDTENERDEFYDMAKKFKFTNPRQLLRLRNCYRLIKALELQKARKKNQELEFKTLKSLMRMLFWQEFLHNRSKRLRKACVKALYEDVNAEKISDEPTKVIVKQVKNLILESFANKEIHDETAKDVRIVVLPHSQED